MTNRYSATYSPDDNKLRLSAVHRLDAETYEKVKAAGYRWAPKLEQFICPAWTPQAEDVALELAGEIEDEDSSLIERAEDRAERFEGYQGRRMAEAEQAHAAVDQVAKRFEGGQPILVGHHSEKRARKDAERIENGMRRAVDLWKTSEYWKDRAAAAIRHAKYKERPDVRARRIKGLEADRRRMERAIQDSEKSIRAWHAITEQPERFKRQDGEPSTLRERARYVANLHSVSKCFTLAEFPRNPPASQYEGMVTLWSALGDTPEQAIITPEQAQEIALRVCGSHIPRSQRWIDHYDNRLAYERAMLAESGYQPPPKPKSKADLPILNYGGVISYRNPYRGDELVTGEAAGVTKAEWAAINIDYKGTRVSACGTHRVRTTMMAPGHRHQLVAVFLTDSKQHKRPTVAEIAAKADEEQREREEVAEAKLARLEARRRQQEAEENEEQSRPVEEQDREQALRDLARQVKAITAQGGIQVVSAPQLFPTPPEIARQMVSAAGWMHGRRVLEPSAGTGNLIRAIIGAATGADSVQVVAVEVDARLCRMLEQQRQKTIYANESNFDIRCADFLACNGDLGKFDRIVMNPPFADGADIKHINHAVGFLKPGGVLVALCANGPRQRAALMPLADEWEDLPADSFKEAGTGVSVAMLVIRAGA